VVERPIDPFPGTPRDTPTTTPGGTGRTTTAGDPDYDTGRSTTPQTPGRTDGPGQASIVEVNGVSFKFLSIPDQRVEVRGRTVDVRDLTVGQYREFVRAHPARPRVAEPLRAHLPTRRTGRTARRNGDQWDAIPDEALDLPITGVDFRVAKDLAAWFQMRLPTEAEWLAAARAAGGRSSIPGSVVKEIATFLNSTPEWTEEETVGSVDRSGAPGVGAPRDGTFGIRLAR
jgi:formylglycine-generating enzyme required for sulfatase activity